MKPYRKNVGIVVFNSAGQVLAGERLGYAGNFQFPQGGLDADEEPLAAARRELYEEIGLSLHEAPVYELPEWLQYDFPKDVPARLKKYAGQRQRWFFFYWNGSIDELRLDQGEQEFSQLRWFDFRELVEQIVPFKDAIYRRLYAEGQLVMERFLAAHRSRPS